MKCKACDAALAHELIQITEDEARCDPVFAQIKAAQPETLCPTCIKKAALAYEMEEHEFVGQWRDRHWNGREVWIKD